MSDKKADQGAIRPCKACGRTIWIVRGPNGKAVPLDMESTNHVYEVSTSAENGSYAVKGTGYVSHFLTCTDPNRFSKGKKEDPKPAEQSEMELKPS